MAIVKSIHEALKRGANHDEIVNQIALQNPNKAKSIEEARKRGASSLNIISEIIRQNPMSSDFVSETERPIVEKGNKLNEVIRKSAEYNKPTSAYTGGENILQGGIKAATNLPSSAYQFGKGLVSAVTHPTGIRNIISGGVVTGLEKLTGKDINQRDSEQEQMFRGLVDYMKNRYGGLENLTATAVNDPFGFGTEILAVAQGGASLLGKGKQLETGLSKVVSPITKPIEKGFTKLGEVAKKGTTKLLSITSDAPEEAIKILQEREIPIQKIKTSSPEKSLSLAQGSVKNLRNTLTKEWQQGINQLKKQLTGKKIVLNKQETKLLNKLSDDFGIDIPLDKKISMLGQKTIVKEMGVERALELNKSINELLSKPLIREGEKGAFVRKFKSMLDNKLGEFEGVDNFLKQYSVSKQVFDEADKILRTYKQGNPITQKSAMNRLSSIFDEGNSHYLKAITELEKRTGVDILGEVASTKFKDILPSSITKISGGLSTKVGLLEKGLKLLALPITSPRGTAMILKNLKSPNIKIPQFISADKIIKTGIGTSKINK